MYNLMTSDYYYNFNNLYSIHEHINCNHKVGQALARTVQFCVVNFANL